MGTPTIERQLQELDALGATLPEPAALKRVRQLLGSRSNVVVARAAKVISRLPDHGLETDFAAAFRRFLVDPVRTDRACLAKLALVDAVRACAHIDCDILYDGLRHVQLEPGWGRPVDTAAQLRALCALGLVEAGAAGILDDLAVLLADSEAEARIGAARALGACGPLATPLLRFKVLTGDEQPLVTAECLCGLMTAAPQDSFDFVSALIDPAHPEIAGHAAMALAESHVPDAFDVLKEKWEDAALPDFRRDLLLPIGLTRHEQAPDLLLTVLESGDLVLSTAAIAALAIYKGDPGMAERARNAIRGRYRNRLLAVLDQAFG